VLALVAVVALGALSAYLWSVHSQYVAQNEQLRDEAESLGTDVATAQAQVEELQAQVDETAAQLQEAKDTVNGLANSEAQAGDDRQALIDIVTGLQECADLRQDLIDHLNESYKWTASSLAAREDSITSYCKKVTKAYNEIIDD
jgi:chromosome segregation ATPase